VELSWTNAQRLALCMFPPDPEVWAKSYFRICSSNWWFDLRLYADSIKCLPAGFRRCPIVSPAKQSDRMQPMCFSSELCRQHWSYRYQLPQVWSLKEGEFLGYFLTLSKISNGIECSHRFQLFHIVDAVNWWFTRGRHSYLGERCYSSKSRTAEQNFTTSENAVTGHFERPLRHTHRCCLWNFNQVRYWNLSLYYCNPIRVMGNFYKSLIGVRFAANASAISTAGKEFADLISAFMNKRTSWIQAFRLPEFLMSCVLAILFVFNWLNTNNRFRFRANSQHVLCFVGVTLISQFSLTVWR